MTENTPRDRGSERIASIETWLRSPQEGEVTAVIASLRDVRRTLLEEMADRLAPALNDHLRRQPQATYEQKKQLAKWLNAELRTLDLAIESPRTHMPAILVASFGDDRERGRFQLKVSLPEGRRTKMTSMATLAPLRLTARDAGFDKQSLWTERTRDRSGDLPRQRD